MSKLWNELPSRRRKAHFDSRLDNLFAAVGLYVDLFLDRTFDQRRCADLPNLPKPSRLAVKISFRVFDLDARIRTFDFNLVVALFHILRDVRK